MSTRLVIKRHKIYLYINPFQKPREAGALNTGRHTERPPCRYRYCTDQALDSGLVSFAVHYLHTYSTRNNGKHKNPNVNTKGPAGRCGWVSHGRSLLCGAGGALLNGCGPRTDVKESPRGRGRGRNPRNGHFSDSRSLNPKDAIPIGPSHRALDQHGGSETWRPGPQMKPGPQHLPRWTTPPSMATPPPQWRWHCTVGPRDRDNRQQR